MIKKESEILPKIRTFYEAVISQGILSDDMGAIITRQSLARCIGARFLQDLRDILEYAVG